jgi:hypothetical protein
MGQGGPCRRHQAGVRAEAGAAEFSWFRTASQWRLYTSNTSNRADPADEHPREIDLKENGQMKNV